MGDYVASSVPLQRLGHELRRCRKNAGRTQQSLGAAIGRNQATITNWELGRTQLAEADLSAIAKELELTAEETARLQRLREESNESNDAWTGFGLGESLRPFVVMEEEAAKISTFQLVLVPGLLQTEDYIRALLLVASENTSRAHIERRVSSRLKRQRKLDDTNFQLHAVIAEPVLMAQVGEPDAFVAQLETLIMHAQRKNVVLQVVPASKGAHPGADGSFSLLTFDDETSPPLAYFDTPLSGTMVTNQRDVDFLTARFERICQYAKSPEDSLKIIERVLRSKRKGRP